MISLFSGIGIFMLLYFSPKILTGLKAIKKRSPIKKEKKPAVEPEKKSETAPKAEASKVEKTQISVLGKLNRIAITLVLVACAAWILVNTVPSVYKSVDDFINYFNEGVKSSDVTLGVSHAPKVWVKERIERISFTGEYGEAYRGVSLNTNTSSANLTEDVWVKQKNKKPIKVLRGQDIFLFIGNTIDNNELRFKSVNGKTGSIDIVFWK